ncbi:hypothetical protein DSM112329_01965 [Paraconexibacter sp. AEG42_29]|uniref:Uncharacterized protein n=1 Tax=Paraconexibacter sp. AEG42_29 TaxID=2997339 RepID=A0AAU7AU26_9ACTN
MSALRSLTFWRHYVEMVVAMLVGMAVLFVPAEHLLEAAGADDDNAPALLLAVMCVAMTAPMVGWMRYRGHRWRVAGEMAAAMVVPTLGVLALLAAGAVTDYTTLMMAEHTVMFPAMLGVMLARPDEYAHRHPRPRAATT